MSTYFVPVAFIFMRPCAVCMPLCVCVPINVMNTASPFRLLVKVEVLSCWKLSLPFAPVSELCTHTHTHTFQQIHYIRSKTNFAKHFRHCLDCGGVQLLVHLSLRLGADSGCLCAPLTHTRKTFSWLNNRERGLFSRPVLFPHSPSFSANSWPYPTCFSAPSVFLSSAKWASCF